MKQILSAVLFTTALLTGTFAYSNPRKPVKVVSKEISINSPFQQIKLGSYIQMVLVQDPSRTTVLIEGDENYVSLVNVSIDKGILSISSKSKLKSGKIEVYVPVSNLSLINVGSEASARTQDVVKLDHLTVIVNDGSKTDLHILGNLKIEPAEGCDFVYSTYIESKVIYVQK